MLSNALADVFHAQGHLLFIFYLQQQQKLLSSQPDKRLTLASDQFTQQLGQLTQHQITNIVPQLIVDPFEVIEIEQ